MTARALRVPRSGELPDFRRLPAPTDPSLLRAEHDAEREPREIPSRLTQDVADLTRTNVIGAL